MDNNNKQLETPPCEDCICIPICKLRGYSNLLDQCKIVDEYLYPYIYRRSDVRFDQDEAVDIFSSRVLDVAAIMKPVKWYVEKLTMDGERMKVIIGKRDDKFKIEYHRVLPGRKRI